jgi:hypothetical protein
VRQPRKGRSEKINMSLEVRPYSCCAVGHRLRSCSRGRQAGAPQDGAIRRGVLRACTGPAGTRSRGSTYGRCFPDQGGAPRARAPRMIPSCTASDMIGASRAVASLDVCVRLRTITDCGRRTIVVFG